MKHVLILLVVMGLSGPVLAQQPPPPAEAGPPPESESPPPPGPVVTEHSLTLADGRTLAYSAEAGLLTLSADERTPAGHMFYTAYRVESEAERPLTFVFNGGPGAASAWLHLGLMGPKRLVFGDDGAPPPPPARLTVNPESWLAFTDLVFVDPVGTGYSRAESPPEGEGENLFWGVDQDLGALGEFMRLYLTRQGRWGAPVYLAGESYGGFRVAALAARLPEEAGIALSGAILISPVIDYGHVRDSRFGVLPWVLRVPSLAAAARFWERAEGDPADLGAVETFARDRLLPALTGQGDRGAIWRDLAARIGLAPEMVAGWGGRIPIDVFARELMGESGRLVSVYDASLDFLNPEPPGVGTVEPLLELLRPPFTAAFARYVAEDLDWHSDLEYRLLDERTHARWDWDSGMPGHQGHVGAGDALARAVTLQPDLKVWILHGRYDLVTPYFASAVAVAQMDLAGPVRDNVRLSVYDGGHMMYTHDPVRRAVSADAAAFYGTGE